MVPRRDRHLLSGCGGLILAVLLASPGCFYTFDNPVEQASAGGDSGPAGDAYAPECTQNQDCPPGMVCEVDRCDWPPSSLTCQSCDSYLGAGRCGPDALCVDFPDDPSVCAMRCETNADCPSGFECSVVESDQSCVTDDDCDDSCDEPRERCVVQALHCESDVDCELATCVGDACQLGRACIATAPHTCRSVGPLGICGQEEDCPPGAACVDDHCRNRFCDVDTDCPTGLACAMGLGICGECRTHADCSGASAACSDKIAACVTAPACSYFEDEDPTDNLCYQCLTDAVCTGYCERATRTCYFCNDGSDCASRLCDDATDTCWHCTTSDDCGPGLSCDVYNRCE